MVKKSRQPSDEERIRYIFNNGSNRDVLLLLEFENDPEVSEEMRRKIKKVRTTLRSIGHPIVIVGDGNRRIYPKRVLRGGNYSEKDYTKY